MFIDDDANTDSKENTAPTKKKQSKKTRQNVEEKTFDKYTIEDDEDVNIDKDPSKPYYSVSLPSQGKLGYPEILEYRDITVKDEKAISTATETNFRHVLNNLLKSILGDPSFFKKISIYDREYLLLWIWSNNYSPIQRFQSTCMHCGTKSEQKTDVTKLPVSDLSDEFTMPFKLTLHNGKEVGLNLITIGDEEIAEKFIKVNKEYTMDMALIASSIDIGAVVPMKQKMDFIEENMNGRDMGIIRSFHKYFKYGADTTHEYTCDSCGGVNVMEIPFRADYFLPDLQTDFEEILRSNKVSKD